MTPQTEISWRGKADVAGVAVVRGASLAIEQIEDFFALEIFRISKNSFLLTTFRSSSH